MDTDMSRYDVSLASAPIGTSGHRSPQDHEPQDLPEGWTYGTHVSGPGWSGYYLLRESDGASLVARVDADSSREPVTAEDLERVLAGIDSYRGRDDHCQRYPGW